MGFEGLGVSHEARIVGGDMAGGAAIHMAVAEAGDDYLLNAWGARFQFGAFVVVLRERSGLLEIGGLVVLPLVEELVPKTRPCTMSTTKLAIARGSLIESVRSEWGNETPVRPPEEGADDDKDDVE
jgi:hypothetical protein